MAHFLIDSKMFIHPALCENFLLFSVLGISQQDRRGQLVIQEPALDVSGSRQPGAGIKAHIIPRHDAQLLCLLP